MEIKLSTIVLKFPSVIQEWNHLWFCEFCTVLLFTHWAAFPPFWESITICYMSDAVVDVCSWGNKICTKLFVFKHESYTQYSELFIHGRCGNVTN